MASAHLPSWQELAREVQEHRDTTLTQIEPPLPQLAQEIPLNVTSIPRKILSDEEIEITQTPVAELVETLASGKLSAVTATNAFLRRAAIAQQLAGSPYAKGRLGLTQIR